MPSIYKLCEEVHGEAINIIEMGYDTIGALAPFLFDLKTLNNKQIDWRNFKPKDFGVKVNSGYYTDSNKHNRITWQEVDIRDQILSVTNVNAQAKTITVSVVGPITYKRGTSFWNVTQQEEYKLTADATTNTEGQTTLTLTVADVKNAAQNNVLRFSGYTKPYGLNEGNVASEDNVRELYNLFTGTNVVINLDENELNASYRYFGKEGGIDYFKQKTREAARELLLGIQRAIYTAERGTYELGGQTTAQCGGLDYFIRNVSGIAGINLGTATGAGTGEININADNTVGRKNAFLDALSIIMESPAPTTTRNTGLTFFTTTPFLREVEKMFSDSIVYNDEIRDVNLNVTKISFTGYTVDFIVDPFLNDINRIAGYRVVRKTAYVVPTSMATLVLKPNRALLKNENAVAPLGSGVYFYPPQSAEEKFSLRLYTTYSIVWGGITSGLYRKINFTW